MRAVVVNRFGGPEVLEPAELADPVAGPGQLLVRLEAAGVNYADVYARTGAVGYAATPPFVPGSEGAGRVVATGDGVAGFAVDDPVVWCGVPGGYAELAVVPADRAVALPAGLAAASACAAMLQGLTAHYLSHSTVALAAGDTVLVHAAAGGVGLLLTQLAVARGATVLATTSGGLKAELAAQAGAAHVLDYHGCAERVRELTGGQGVAVVYDGVGAATFESSLACLRRRGTLVLYGAASGPVPPFDLQRLNSGGSLYVTRPTLAHYVATRAELLERAEAVLGGLAAGTLSVRIGGRYALADAARAHSDLQARASTGKLLLVPAG